MVVESEIGKRPGLLIGPSEPDSLTRANYFTFRFGLTGVTGQIAQSRKNQSQVKVTSRLTTVPPTIKRQ
jgi:hypothetical protein